MIFGIIFHKEVLMGAKEEINSMVKKAGWMDWFVNWRKRMAAKESREWRKEHGLPEYPFSRQQRFESVRGAAQAVSDAQQAAGDLKPKYYTGGKAVVK